jgi:hypothetical protein
MREEHAASVYTAKNAIGEVQGHLATIRDLSEGNIGLVAAATGGNAATNESAQNAFVGAVSLLELIDNLYRTTEMIVNELDRYAGGF